MSTYHHAVERTIYVGNIGRSVTEQALLALFGPCGTITNIRLAGDPTFDTRYAFIEFSHADEHAIRVSPARGGGPLRSNDPDRVNKTIHVAGLPMEDIEEDVLAEFFSHCGERTILEKHAVSLAAPGDIHNTTEDVVGYQGVSHYSHVVAVRKNGRFAWVEFGTVSGMQAALNLDGEPMGNSSMKVQQSRTPIMNAGWRAPGNELDPSQQIPNTEYEARSSVPQDPQYDSQYYWANTAPPPPQAPPNPRNGAPTSAHYHVPAQQSYNLPNALGSQMGGMMEGDGNGNEYASTIPAPHFQGTVMQPPPPGTMKVESEMTNHC